MSLKRIGVLTSGGDAPGMNAAIRAVVRTACYHGMEVVGVQRGFRGLIENDFREMNLRSVGDIVQRGGTILRTARCEEFKHYEPQQVALKNIYDIGIEGIVVIGGDGSFMGAKDLSEMGIPTVGVPGTIDNDMHYTDFTIGFDTAVNTSLHAINCVRDTAHSHDRTFLVEVMGRHCGDIAMHAGLAGGAEMILVPEMPWSVEAVSERLKYAVSQSKLSSIIVVAEGIYTKEIPHLHALKDALQVMDPLLDIRALSISHVQRGGSPTATDRNLASRLGYHAATLLGKGIGNRACGIVHNEIVDLDIFEALKVKRKFDEEGYRMADILAR